MNEYTVVGPMNDHSRCFKSLLIAFASWLSPRSTREAQSFGADRFFGSNDQTYFARLPNSSINIRHWRALLIVASIFALLRTIPASSKSRSTLRVLKRATASISKDLNALRKFS